LNNVLIYSDLHINQTSLKECFLILEEIGMLANKYNVDTLINLGDTFDGLKPSSSEMDVFATFIRRLGNHKKHIIIAADSHESETQTVSVINHFGILNEMVTVVKEFKDNNHIYCGHFSIKESATNYDAKLSKEEFKDYVYVFLGHIHSYELIKPNILHLGSCRYVNFDEAKDKQKIVALITDYGMETEKIHFMALKSPIPMVQLELGKKTVLGGSNDTIQTEKVAPEAKESGFLGYFKGVSDLSAYLGSLDPKTKVKVKILDFESFRQFLPFCSKHSTKFETFKYTTEFNVVSDLTPNSAKKQITNFKESLSNWLNQQNVDNKIKEILQKEIE
jgi:DNA repair exonuclease SbcCD nuclease subunit